MRRLLSGCGILAWENDDFSYIPKGYLGVDGDTICYIGTERPLDEYDKVLDLQGRLVMPGLINCHGHSAMTMLRGVGSGYPLKEWLFDHVFPVEDRLTEEDYIAGYELAMMEMIAGGTTSFSDMYMLPWLAIELNKQVGMKMNLGRVMQSFDPAETAETSPRPKEATDLFEKYHGTQNDRIHVDFIIHAEYTIFDQTARGFMDKVRPYRDQGAVVQIHLSETKSEHEECIVRHGLTPVAWAEKMGILDLPAGAAHCVWITPEDMDILKKHGATIIHNPSSNMKLGSGFAPIREALDKGVNVTIGTDGAASNNNLNMFEEMHIAGLIHNGYHLDPLNVSAEEILKMATVNGARMQGRPDTGCLQVGKKADLIAVDFRKPHMYPVQDIFSMLVYSAQASDVCLTMVDGRILYQDGEYLTLDPDKVMADARMAFRRLYEKED